VSQSATAALRPATSAAVTGSDARELYAWFAPHVGVLQVEQVICGDDGVVIEARPGSDGAACPACGAWSSRVHSGYAAAGGHPGRRPAGTDPPGRAAVLVPQSCLPGRYLRRAGGRAVGRYQRRSLPLLASLAQIGLALAGRAGARLAAVLGVAVHRTTLLGLVAALPEPEVSAAQEVTGVDDFALQKGRVYGTVLVDVGAGKAVDLLPDREAGPLEAWLTAHPGAKVVCRDRARGYADGARQGAPDAIQVADRWHLWHNLGEYVEKAVAAHRGCLSRAAGTGSAPSIPGPAAAGFAAPAEPEGLRDVCGRERRLVARTRDRHAAVHGLLAAGHSKRDAAGILGLSHGTVNRFAAATAEELLVKATTGRASSTGTSRTCASDGTRESSAP